MAGHPSAAVLSVVAAVLVRASGWRRRRPWLAALARGGGWLVFGDSGRRSGCLARSASCWMLRRSRRRPEESDRARSGPSALPVVRSVVPAWWWRPRRSGSVCAGGFAGRRRLRVFPHSFGSVGVRRKICSGRKSTARRLRTSLSSWGSSWISSTSSALGSHLRVKA